MPSYGRRTPKRATALTKRKSTVPRSRPLALSRSRTLLRPRDVSVPRPLWSRKSYTCKLTYTDKIELSPAGGSTNYYTFRANGPYDPDYSGTGHQPRYWDLVTPGWKEYTVLGSKITVQFLPSTASDSAQPGVYWLQESGGTANAYGSIQDAREDRQQIMPSAPTDGHVPDISKTFSLKALAGSKYGVADDQYTSLVSSTPPTQRYFILTGGSIGSGAASTMFFLVTIDYVVRFSNGNLDVGDS